LSLQNEVTFEFNIVARDSKINSRFVKNVGQHCTRWLPFLWS